MTTVAFVGCAHSHTPGFINTINNRPDITCKSVWDHDTARAEKYAAELGATVVTDLNAIYADSEITAAIVCTETNRHEEVVLPGAVAGKHLFVEKPLGFGVKDAERMVAAIEKAGVIYQTGYFMRGEPNHLFLKEQIAQGAFGKITRVRGSNCHSAALGRWFSNGTLWMADPKIAGVGAFGDLGTHSLDILLWLLGDVAAVTAQIDKGIEAYLGCDETGEGLMRFANGTIGTLAAGWDDVANPVSLLISGTEGHATIINGELYFQSIHVDGADGKQPWTDLPAKVPAGLESFLNAITGRQDAVLVSVREAACRSIVMAAMYEGATQEKWVKVG